MKLTHEGCNLQDAGQNLKNDLNRFWEKKPTVCNLQLTPSDLLNWTDVSRTFFERKGDVTVQSMFSKERNVNSVIICWSRLSVSLSTDHFPGKFRKSVNRLRIRAIFLITQVLLSCFTLPASGLSTKRFKLWYVTILDLLVSAKRINAKLNIEQQSMFLILLYQNICSREALAFAVMRLVFLGEINSANVSSVGASRLPVRMPKRIAKKNK